MSEKELIYCIFKMIRDYGKLFIFHINGVSFVTLAPKYYTISNIRNEYESLDLGGVSSELYSHISEGEEISITSKDQIPMDADMGFPFYLGYFSTMDNFLELEAEILFDLINTNNFFETLVTDMGLSKPDLNKMQYSYSWIKVKKYIEDTEVSFEEKYNKLLAHHKDETQFLLETVRKLAGLVRCMDGEL